jgi:hypothetical protein
MCVIYGAASRATFLCRLYDWGGDAEEDVLLLTPQHLPTQILSFSATTANECCTACQDNHRQERVHERHVAAAAAAGAPLVMGTRSRGGVCLGAACTYCPLAPEVLVIIWHLRGLSGVGLWWAARRRRRRWEGGVGQLVPSADLQ